MAVIAPVVAGVAAAGAASAAGATAFAVSLAYTLASTAVSLALMKKTHSSSDVGKMESLKKMEVKYGAVLPEIYGTIETAGNIIWASNFQEHKKEDTTNVGKGGGSSHTTTTYSYSISFAVAFCIGEITNLQYIKFNDKKVLDLSSNGGGYSNFKTHYEFYKGTEEQLPSSVIESYEGAGNVEAYRNVCYIVFENLDLTEFGNQIPNVTVCLSKSIDKNEVKPHFEEFNSILKYSEKESNAASQQSTSDGLREYNENDKCLYLFNRSIAGNKVNVIKYDVFNKKVLRELNINDVNTSDYHHKEAFFINNKQNFVLFNKNAESMFIYNTNDFTLQKEIKVKDFDKKLDDSSDFVNNISGFREIYKTGFIFSQSNLASYFYARSKNGWSPTLYHNEFVLCGISYDLSKTSQNLFKISKNSNVQNYRNRQNSIFFNDTTALNLQNNNANVISLVNIKATSSSGINEYPNYNDCKPTFYKNKTNEIYSFSIQSSSDLNINNIMDTRFMLTLSKVNLSNMKFEEDCDIIINSSLDDYNDRDYKNGLPATRRTDVNYFNYNEKTDEVVFLLNHSFTDLPVTGKPICQRTFSLIKYNLTTKKKEVAQNFFYSDARYTNNLAIYFDKEKNELKGRINGIQKNRYYNNNEGTSNVNKFVKIKLNNFNYEIYDVQNDSIGKKIINGNVTYINDIDTFINITPLNNDTTKETTYRDIRFKPLTFVKGKYPLDKLVKDLCLKNNLNEDDIDVTSLENDEVKGFVIHSENSIRDCIQQLASVYNFDVVESDWKIKFKKANKNNIVKYINENELNAQEFNDEMNFNENIVINRVHELALPKTLNLNYFDYDKEYEQNTQDCIKYTTKSVDTSNISVNVILTADEAKNIAAVLLESAYTQKDTFQFTLNYDHLDLEPLDIIHISLHNGANYTVKITKIESDKGLIKVQAVKEDSTIYNQNLKGETGLIKETTPQLISQTESIFIDMPIFRDSDDDFGFYVGSKKKNENFSWSGSVLSKASNLNSNFIEIMSFTSPLKTGYTKNKLENYVDGLTIDSFNELEVYSEQQLESLDDDDFLNGRNLAIVGNEYILFKNAELTANKTYKLTGLLRGMFNTQNEIDKHNQVERFILINNQTSINRVNLDFTNTSNFYYKNTTFKNNINDTSIENFINNSKGKMCYNVFDVRSNRDVNNNLNITYKTASRNINYLIDDNVNVDFDKNLFEIVIYSDNTYSTVVNTIQTNNTSVIYTQQQQINDFSTVKNEIFIEIFKLNENNKRNLGYKTSV